MIDFDPSFYYVRDGDEWVPKSQATPDGGREEDADE